MEKTISQRIMAKRILRRKNDAFEENEYITNHISRQFKKIARIEFIYI